MSPFKQPQSTPLRNSGPAHPAHARLRSRARPRDRRAHSAHVERHSPHRDRLAVSGPSPAGRTRLDRSRVEDIRQGKARQVLPAHPGRATAATRSGTVAMAATLHRGGKDPSSGGVRRGDRAMLRQIYFRLRSHLALAAAGRRTRRGDPLPPRRRDGRANRGWAVTPGPGARQPRDATSATRH